MSINVSAWSIRNPVASILFFVMLSFAGVVGFMGMKVQQFPDIDLSKTKVGIWSRVVKLRDSVSDGDRIEIYRPLIADPKEIRKRRAEKAKEEGRADKVTGGRVNPLKAKESQGEK